MDRSKPKGGSFIRSTLSHSSCLFWKCNQKTGKDGQTKGLRRVLVGHVLGTGHWWAMYSLSQVINYHLSLSSPLWPRDHCTLKLNGQKRSKDSLQAVIVFWPIGNQVYKATVIDQLVQTNMPKDKNISRTRPRSVAKPARNAIYQLNNKYSSSLPSLGEEVADMVATVAKEVPYMVIV